MVSLDISSINAIAPYKIESVSKNGYVHFVTDFGVHYSVGFDSADDLLGYGTYQFVISNANNKKSPRDEKLRNTIIAIIYAFFDSYNSALLYICETGDNKQSLRSRLFEFWYKTSLRRAEFEFYSAEIIDSEGISNYASLIVRKDNPNIEQIKMDFQSSVNVLNNKPR